MVQNKRVKAGDLEQGKEKRNQEIDSQMRKIASEAEIER